MYNIFDSQKKKKYNIFLSIFILEKKINVRFKS